MPSNTLSPGRRMIEGWVLSGKPMALLARYASQRRTYSMSAMISRWFRGHNEPKLKAEQTIRRAIIAAGLNPDELIAKSREVDSYCDTSPLYADRIDVIHRLMREAGIEVHGSILLTSSTTKQQLKHILPDSIEWVDHQLKQIAAAVEKHGIGVETTQFRNQFCDEFPKGEAYGFLVVGVLSQMLLDGYSIRKIAQAMGSRYNAIYRIWITNRCSASTYFAILWVMGDKQREFDWITLREQLIADGKDWMDAKQRMSWIETQPTWR